MKLPRWLVIAMLTTSVLLPLAAAGWGWVTWPERTAREFVELVGAQRLDEANQLVPARTCPRISLRLVGTLDGWNRAKLVPHLRTPIDWLVGRQRFTFGRFKFEITAERGKIILRDEEIFVWVEPSRGIAIAPDGIIYDRIIIRPRSAIYSDEMRMRALDAKYANEKIETPH